MGWLLLKSFGLPRYLWAILAVAALVAAVLWLRAAERADDAANQQVGATIERAETTGVVIERVEQGNAVRNQVEAEAGRGAGDALYEQCVRSQGGAASVCERFLPQRP